MEDRNLLSLTVNTTIDENDGYDVGNRSLREAIAKAATTSETDVIEFDQSLAGKTIELSGQITIDSDVNIIGLGAGSLTVDANGSSSAARRIFQINPARTVAIDGLTLTGGYLTGTSDGAAIHNSGNLTLENVVVANNATNHFGGAVYSTEQLTLKSVLIRDNTSQSYGGGIYNSGDTLRVEDSTFENNEAVTGGAISVYSSNQNALVIERSAIINNRAVGAGAIHISGNGGTAAIINTTISGNEAETSAGAIQMTTSAPSLTIINSTITDNHADTNKSDGVTGTAGGIRVSGGYVQLHNTILAGNTSGQVSNDDVLGALISTSSYNILGANIGLPSAGDGNYRLGATESVLLSPLGDYGGPTKTHVLLPGSRAIDKGSNAQSKDSNNSLLTKDQRGFLRPVDNGTQGPTGTTVDIGAVEWHQSIAVGDFDGDGRQDEAFLDGYTASLYVASNPNGKLQVSKWGSWTASATDNWRVGDFNGDGRDDIAFCDPIILNLWYVAFSESTRFVVTSTNAGGQVWQQTLVGDFDGDGRDELIGRYDSDLNGSIDKWSLIDYNPAGQFTQYNIGAAFTSSFYTRVHAGDVNGDGRDDLVSYLGGGEWGVAITSLDPNGRAQLPATVTNVGNWFRDEWVNDVGTAAESVDVEGPYRRLLEIFSEVYNSSELELYPGLMKGIEATAETKAGNPWDQAALLVDLLDTAGFQSKIVFGKIDAPLNEVREWLGVTEDEAAEEVIRLGLDANVIRIGNTLRFKHAWVQVNVPTDSGLTPVYLDPSWKFKDRQSGETISLAISVPNYTPPTFSIDGRSGRGTFDEFGFLANSSDNQLPVEWYEDQVMNYLTDTGKNKSLADVAYDGPILQQRFKQLPQITGQLLGSTAMVTPGTTSESFENLAEILSSTTLKNRFVHQATISLSREKSDDARSISLAIPGDEGQMFASSDFDAPGSRVIDVTAQHSFHSTIAPPLDGGNTTLPGNGARRISGTKHLSIAIPNGYTITPNTTLQVTYTSNAIGHGLAFGWDNDFLWEHDTEDRLAVATIFSGTQTVAVTQGGSSSYSADRVVLGLRHASHGGGQTLQTTSWIDISNVRLYEASTGTATVIFDAGDEKNIEQQGRHYLDLGTAGLNYQVTSNSILELEFKAPVTGALHAVGWDVDDTSSNDAGQASRRFRLAGSSSTYPLINPVETLSDGYKRFRLPIGQGVAAGQSALLDRLIFYTDGGPTTESLFRNLKLTTDLGVAGEHWVSPSLAIPQHSLAQITIDYVKTENASATTDDDTYRSRLWVGAGGSPLVEGTANEILQVGDKALIRIQHQSPTEFGITVGPTAADHTYKREPGQIHAIGFDANQASQTHLTRLQAELNSLLADGDDVSDIDELLTYASAKYWHDFNQSTETIDALMQTIGVQQWVGSGIVTADPILIGGDLSHLNFPIAPLNMGVDLPNSTHTSIEIHSGDFSDEAFQLVGWNASALENAVVEELINAESISTVRGLKYAYDSSVRIFESYGNASGTPTIYFRGVIGDYAGTSGNPTYQDDRINLPILRKDKLAPSDNEALVYWLGLSDEVVEDIWAALNEAVAVGDTVRVIAPRFTNIVGEAPLAWEGAVYVAEVNTSTSKSGRYIIAPLDGSEPSSGGYSGNKIEPINLNLPKLNNDLRSWAGDPVSVANGNMFRDEVDFSYSNLGVPLSFARHYESGSKYDVGLGVGWSHSFSDRLLQDPDDLNTIEWLTSTGAILKFVKQDGVWKPPASRFGQFSETTTTFVWKGADGMEYHFKKVSSLAAGDGKNYIGRLEKIVDRDGHGVTLTYTTTTGFTLSQAQDIHEPNRRLEFAYASNRITGVTRIATGTTSATWTYTYNLASGQLAAGTRLAKVTSPSDVHTTPTITEYKYADSGPSLGLMTKIIEPDGGYHKYEYFANGRVFRVMESVDLRGTSNEDDDITTSQSFNYNLFRELTEFTDENGNVETYLHDEKGQLLRQVHDDRSRLVYEYGTEANNESALMVTATDERGAREEFTYFRSSDIGQPGYSGRHGELKEHKGKDGVATTFEYWQHPYISELTKTTVSADGISIPTEYARDSLGHLTNVTDALGNRTEYTYYGASDPAHLRGKLKSETKPKGTTSPEAVGWEILNNSFFVSGDTLSVQLLSGTTASELVVADAIRIDRIDPEGDFVFTRIIDDNGSGEELGFRRESGSFTFFAVTASTYGGDFVRFQDSSTEQPVATWILEDLTPGTYRISATWPGLGLTADQSTKYRIFNGLPSSTADFTSSPKDQRYASDDFGNFKTVFQYDATGNLTSAITEQLPAGTAVYDSFGYVRESVDATGVVTFTTRDVLGRTVRAGFADPDGTTGPLAELATTFVYDAIGRLVKSTDALNRVTESKYDLKGRLIKQSFADGSTMEYGYDGKGNRTSVTDELGRKTAFIYDDRDRVIQTIHPDGASDRVQYDGAGNITATLDALGHRTEFTYDKSGRLLTTTFAADTLDQIQTSNLYDTLGRLVETVDANGNTTIYRHDALGRVVETRVLDKSNANLPPKFLSTTEYDANGRVVRTTVYDAARLLASVASGGGGLIAIPADPTTLIGSLGDSVFLHVTETKYDSFDRPVEMTYADATSSSIVYDAAGRVRLQFDELGRRTEFEYDEYGRLIKTIAPDPDGAFGPQLSPETEYEYDTVGNIVTIIDPRDVETTRAYDVRNRLVSEIDGVGSVRQTIYDVAGQAVAAIDPRGFAASTRYDERGRAVLQQLVDPDGTGIASAPTTRQTYDDVGNVLSSTDALGNTIWFQYDSLNRLRKESRYESLIADDSAHGDTVFSAESGAIQYVGQAASYGRDYTSLDPETEPEATYTFSSLEAGDYRISMTWPATFDAGEADVDVQHYRNEQLLTTISTVVSQTQSPNSFTIPHGNHDLGWETLISSIDALAGDTLKVVIYANSAHSVIADAVRLDRLVSNDYQYDDNGNLVTSTDTLGNVTIHVYDELDRNRQTISADPDGIAGPRQSLITHRIYDGFGNVVEERHGHVTSLVPPLYSARRVDEFEYDKRNRLVKETLDSGAGRLNVTTEFEYDDAGNATLVTDAEGFQTHYRYDNLNRVIDEYRDFGEDREAPLELTEAMIGSYYVDGLFVPSSHDISSDGSSISLTGTAWKTIAIDHLVQHNSVLEFEFSADTEAPAHLIGFDSNNNFEPADESHFFKLGGSGAFGDQYRTDFRRELLADGTVKFHIPIGQYLSDQEKLTGLSINRLVLVNWETGLGLDPIDQGKSTFSNIRLYESDEQRTVTTYDAAGNVITVREASDPRNVTTRYEYDAIGRQTREILDDGGSMERSYSTVYDVSGNVLIDRNDTASTATVHEYDALNRLTKTTLPDPDGNPNTPNGLVTRFGYDTAGQLIRTTNGELEKTYTDYDAQGRVITETDGNGDQTHYRYDSEGNLLSVTDAEENVTSYTYDDLNRLKTETNAFGTRTHAYDNAGTLHSITDRIGRIREFSYDTLDRRTLEEWKTTTNSTVTHRLSWQYDDLGRVTKQTDSYDAILGDADDLVDTFQYDGLGRLTEQTNYDSSSTDRPRVRHEYEYALEFIPDAFGPGDFQRRVYQRQYLHNSSSDVGVAGTVHQFDRLGHVSTLIDYGIDPATSAPVIDSKEFGFDYDTAGNLQAITRTPHYIGAFSSFFEYDKAFRLISITHDMATATEHTFTYDNASRISSFNTIGGGAASRGYSYDDAGQLKTKTGGTAESYVYDDNGNRVEADGQDNITGTGNRLLEDASYYYTYDAEGNLTRRTDKLTGKVTLYTWDHRNRLTRVDELQPPALTFPTSGGFLSYTAQGNIGSGTLTVEDGGQTVHLTDKRWRRIALSSLNLPASYQLTADTVLSFDFYSPAVPGIAAIGLDNNNSYSDPLRHFQVAGTDTTSGLIGVSPGTSYQGGWQHYELRLADFAALYTGGNSLVTHLTLISNGIGESYFSNIRLYEPVPVSSTSYIYDAQDRRVQRVHDANGSAAGGVSSQYFVYDGADLSMTFESATGSASVLTHRYLYGPHSDQVLVDEVFSTISATGQSVSDEVLWLLADHQGSIRDIADGDGDLRKHIEYDSFGNFNFWDSGYYDRDGLPIEGTEPWQNPEALTDQLFHYTGQEWDADAGLYNYNARWYDPTAGRFASEDPSGFDAGDPNLYRYVGNSPLNGTDPTGLYTQLPTSYLPALNNPSFTHATGLSAANFNTYNTSSYSTPSQASSYFREQDRLSSFTNPFYIAPQFTGPTAADMRRANDRLFSEIVSQATNMELYAMRRNADPVASFIQTIPDPVAAYLNSPRAQGTVLAGTAIAEYALAVAVAGGSGGLAAPASLLIAANATDNLYTGFNQLWTGVPQESLKHQALKQVGGPGFADFGEPVVNALFDFGGGAMVPPSRFPNPGQYPSSFPDEFVDTPRTPSGTFWDDTHPLIEGVIDANRSLAHTQWQRALAEAGQESGFYRRVSQGSVNVSEFSGVNHAPNIKPDFMGLTPHGRIDMIEIRSPGQRMDYLRAKLETAMNQLPPQMRGDIDVIDPEKFK